MIRQYPAALKCDALVLASLVDELVADLLEKGHRHESKLIVDGDLPGNRSQQSDN